MMRASSSSQTSYHCHLEKVESSVNTVLVKSQLVSKMLKSPFTWKQILSTIINDFYGRFCSLFCGFTTLSKVSFPGSKSIRMYDTEYSIQYWIVDLQVSFKVKDIFSRSIPINTPTNNRARNAYYLQKYNQFP